MVLNCLIKNPHSDMKITLISLSDKLVASYSIDSSIKISNSSDCSLVNVFIVPVVNTFHKQGYIVLNNNAVMSLPYGETLIKTNISHRITA